MQGKSGSHPNTPKMQKSYQLQLSPGFTEVINTGHNYDFYLKQLDERDEKACRHKKKAKKFAQKFYK